MTREEGVDKLERYAESQDFFRLAGSVVMRLTRAAAREVCERAESHGQIVTRIEGGIWKSPFFQARHDHTWDGVDQPVSSEIARKNNAAAARWIADVPGEIDVFIVTAPPMWRL